MFGPLKILIGSETQSVRNPSFHFTLFLTKLIAVYFDGPVVHFAHRLDFQMVTVHIPFAFSSNVFVKILRHIRSKIILVLDLTFRKLVHTLLK